MPKSNKTANSPDHAGEPAHNEMFNFISHAAGGVLASAGTVVLVVTAAVRHDPVRAALFAIYGATLITLFTASALYHAFRKFASARTVEIFQRLDHGAIYLLIAGSYTPICVTLGGVAGWTIFGLVWALAVAGIQMRIFIKNIDHPLPLSLYGIMGWLAIFAVVPLTHMMDRRGLILLFTGGVLYSIGGILLAKKAPRLWPGVFGFHELWHIFVLSGAVCHYFAMFSLIR